MANDLPPGFGPPPITLGGGTPSGGDGGTPPGFGPPPIVLPPIQPGGGGGGTPPGGGGDIGPPPPTSNSAPSIATDTNAAANSVVEGAAVNTTVGVTAHSTDAEQSVTYALASDSSGGGFKIDPVTGVVTVADSSKINFETAPGHAYTITVNSSDGITSSAQSFTINVTDIAPSTPVDSNAGANTVAEGAAANTLVGVTASSTDVNGPGVTWSLSNSANGAFKIDAATGVVSVADSTKIDFESSGGSLAITAVASDGTLTSSQNFTIQVTDVAPPTPVDANAATNTVAEGVANGSTVGITASALDPNGPVTTYSLTDSAGGRFAINSSTGVVTVANGAAIDFETAAGHAYGITVQATNGVQTTSQAFTIGVTDVAPAAPTDTNVGTNTVLEGAANGTAVGITVASSDPGGGPAPTYTLTDNAGGRFAIDANTGIVTVANGAAIDYETAPGHAYGITVQATSGALSNTQTFSIAVGNVNEAPAGTDKAVLTAEDTAYTFGVADFGFSDPSDSSAPNSLLAVKITTVPGAGTGKLTNNGVTVNAGDFVSAADIAAGHLVFAPVLNANGSPEATFTFQVQDNGGTANGGVDLDQSANTLTINVSAGNDAPVNSVPGTQSVNEEATLTFSTANGNAITISDVDVGAGDETVTLTVANGTLALGSTGGLTSFTNNAASITLTGTVANVNAAMNGLTYHGNLNFNGADSLVVFTSDNGNTGAGGPQSDTDNITINVAPVNDNPVNNVPAAQTAIEDANLVFSAANANAITISDVDGGAGDETVTLTVASGTLALGSTLNLTSFTNNAASITLTGTIANINAALNGLTYHGNANFNGADSLSIVTHDNGNTGGGDLTDTDSITINVTAVNDAPAGTDTTIASAGAHTFAAAEFGFTDPVDAAFAGGANALQAVIITTIPGAGTGTLTLNTGGGPVAVTAGQTIAVGDIGGLVFTPVGNNTGTFTFQVQDNGGLANSGVDTDQSPNSFTITQNAAPIIDSNGGGATAALSAAENQTAVTTVHATDPDNSPVTPVAYSIVGGDDQLKFAIDSSTGVLTFVTPPDFENPTDTSTAGNNTYIVVVQASDGAAIDQQTITVTVTDVNDAPVITSNGGGATASINVNENTTAVTTVTSTDQDSPAQTLTYSLAGGADQGKFSIDPSTGVLTFNTAPNFEVPTDTGGDNGYDVIVRVTDNGAGTLHDDQAITVHVQNVNEAPDTAAVTVTGNEDPTGPAYIPITITGTDVDSGDSVASFHITNIPNTGTQGTLYSDIGLTTQVTEGANVTATGNAATLYFKPNADFNTHAGAVTFNAAATDSHGLTDATPATETINVTAVNDAPVNHSVPSSFTVQAGFNHVISGLSISDVDANEVGTPTDITTTFTAGTGTMSIGNGTSGGTAGIAGGATVSTNATGTVVLTGTVAQINTSLSGNNVVYTAGDSAANTATTLQMATNDHGHNGAPGAITDTDTINIGVIPQVWFINQDQSSLDATATRGSQTNPFATVDEFNASSGPGTNDYIYVKAGTYSGEGINLKAGQTLLGDDQALSFADPLGGPAIQVEDATGARPVINVTAAHATDQGIALASGNTIAGVIVTTNASGQVGIDDSGASVGTLNISDTDVTGSGQAINLTHGGTGGTVALGTVSSTGGSTGIALGGALATNFSATSGTLSGHSTSEVSINGGSGNVSYGGAIGDGTGLSASIVNHTAGTVTFSGNISDGADTGGGIGISGNANTTINFTGATKTLNTGIGDGVSMTNNTGTSNVNFTNGGLDIDTTNGTGFQASVAGTYSVTGSGNTITTTGTGTALNLNTVTVGAGGITFDSASTTNAANGIVINTVSGGAINVNGGTIAGASSHGVDINAAQSNITIASAITSTAAGNSVEVTNSGKSGGNTITFSGAITDPGHGINLDNNDQNGGVATINFTGGLNIDATTHTGFNATNGGTVNVTNGANNSIATTTGTALNIANTTIGASNVTFHDISANGAVNGIVLNTTGSSGHLTVTGSGSAVLGGDSSGGTIQNTTGDGILLTNTNAPSFTNLNIQSTANSGIRGTGVVNFALANSTINNVNTAHTSNDGNVSFNTNGGGSTETNISGTVSITNNNLNNSYQAGIDILNYAGTISNLTITDNHFTSSTSAASSFGSAVSVVANRGAAAAQITAGTISDNTITNFPNGAGIQVIGGTTATGPTVNIGSAASHFIIDGNTITGAGPDAAGLGTNGVALTIGHQSNGYFTVGESGNGNTITNVRGNGIAASLFGTGTASYDIGFNTIDAHNTAGSAGINTGADNATSNTNTPTLYLNIHNNNVQHTQGPGILSTIRSVDGTGYFKIENNSVTNLTAPGLQFGIRVDSGNGSESAGAHVILQIDGNTAVGSSNASHTITDPGIGIRQQHTGVTSSFQIVGLSPSPANDAQMEAYVSSQNPGSAAGTFGTGGTASISGGATYTIGVLPGFPLLAADGGVQALIPTAGETHLSQTQLDSVVAVAIAQWATAGASANQLAMLQATTFSVADLSGTTVGEESSPAHITIDINAAGHGWFVDPTPNDNFEFLHAAGTDLFTDPANAAAGHLDLLTTVSHELGHVLGLDDLTTPSAVNDLMYIYLADGERRLPDASDIALAPTTTLTPTVSVGPAGNPGNDTIDAGHGGGFLFGGGGADNFVFANVDVHAMPPAPVTHVTDYHFAEGDRFDFSALTSQFHATGVDDAMIVRAVEDASGQFATLQVNATDPGAPPSGPNWVSVAQIDGAHAGDAVNVMVDSHSAVHLAQIHVGLLV